MARSRVRGVAGVLLVMIVCAAALVGGYAGAHQWRLDHRAAPPSAPPTPAAVSGATDAPTSPPAQDAPVPAATGVAAALAGPLADPRLGGAVRAVVADADSGAALLDRNAGVPGAPASTAKLATAAAVLAAYSQEYRITTRVVAGSTPGTAVLVGAGDPTLTAAAPGKQGAYPDAARIADLATQLRGKHVTHIVIDTSLFAGPAVSPAWAPEDVPSDYASPITALMVDGGRDTPSAVVRSTDPAGAAGRALAAALGLPASAVSAGHATANAAVLASVKSPPLAQIVTDMLQPSDNVIAECLARLVAVARHQPATFTGAAAAVRAQLRALGVDIGGGMLDGSGLAAGDRISATALVGVLRLAASPAHPTLHDVIAALPVAGWDGTLADRYGGSPAAGLVRAKTGTLTGVSTLAGVAHDHDGRLLVFAVLADRVGPTEADTVAAEAALDRIATTLAACGCR